MGSEEKQELDHRLLAVRPLSNLVKDNPQRLRESMYGMSLPPAIDYDVKQELDRNLYATVRPGNFTTESHQHVAKFQSEMLLQPSMDFNVRQELGLIRGLHLDGSFASEQALIFNTENPQKLLEDLSGNPLRFSNIIPAERPQDISDKKLFSLSLVNNVPGTFGFKAGAEAYCNQYALYPSHGKYTNTYYELRYIATTIVSIMTTHGHDVGNSEERTVKACDKFKQQVKDALTLATHSQKYRALQVIFKRFGYYYPMTVVLGGRVILRSQKSRAYHDSSQNKSEYVNVTGGDGTLLLTQNYDTWIASIAQNPATVLLENFRPMYELLDEDDLIKVEKVYEDVILDDTYIYYRYPLQILNDQYDQWNLYAGSTLIRSETPEEVNALFYREESNADLSSSHHQYPAFVLLEPKFDTDRINHSESYVLDNFVTVDTRTLSTQESNENVAVTLSKQSVLSAQEW
ncbi:hypothetical protein EC973_000262 [Apophysomyces ossiformis]|uniref:MACPF domain-containing protein n=1 Tax=Apophysomyces ossiformis TaxID=679940 RepID=A0A8H7ETN2_9FUNG|nr:hypothetical protein EC973_000262 [Apophysomyces ossiformis]